MAIGLFFTEMSAETIEFLPTKSVTDQDDRGLFCTNLRLVRSGLTFFELLEDMIDKAQHVIHLQTYIFQEDETGMRIARALMEAAMRQVKVFLVVDGYASQGLSKTFKKELLQAGVQFRYFNPLLKSKYFYFGRRLHHKVVVVDAAKTMVGGINISNNYNDTLEKAAWLDWALYAEGKVAVELHNICQQKAKVKSDSGVTSLPVNLVSEVVSCPVNVHINDWVRGKKEITNCYVRALQNSTSHVTIMSSYFLPGKLIRKQLAMASSRGIRIKLIMGSVSDVMLAKHAERYMYRWLLRNNIEIYEYQPRILHAKMAICDGQWLTVGSYNVNNISAYASVELNLEVRNISFAEHAEQRLQQIIENDCVQITKEKHEQSGLISRFIQRSAYDIIRALLFIFTFYFKQHE